MQLIGSIVLQFGRAIAGTLCKTKFAISKIWLILSFYVCRLINFLWHMISISICFEAWKKNFVILLALGIIFYPFFIVSIVFLCLFSTAALTLTSISTIKLHWNDTQECIFVLNTPRFMAGKLFPWMPCSKNSILLIKGKLVWNWSIAFPVNYFDSWFGLTLAVFPSGFMLCFASFWIFMVILCAD